MKDFHSQDHNSDLLLLIHKGWVGPEREWGQGRGVCMCMLNIDTGSSIIIAIEQHCIVTEHTDYGTRLHARSECQLCH